MRRADRWMKKFQPDGPFVAARDGLALNGAVYALGEPVDLTGLGPRRRRVLYDAGRIMYPPQDAVPPIAAVEPPVAPPVEPPSDDLELVDPELDEMAEEFEELFEESEAAAPDEEPKPRVRRVAKRAPRKK